MWLKWKVSFICREKHSLGKTDAFILFFFSTYLVLSKPMSVHDSVLATNEVFLLLHFLFYNFGEKEYLPLQLQLFLFPIEQAEA